MTGNRKYQGHENPSFDRAYGSANPHVQFCLFQARNSGSVEVHFWTAVQGLHGGNGEPRSPPNQNSSRALAKATETTPQEPLWILTLMSSAEKGHPIKAKELASKHSSHSTRSPDQLLNVCTLNDLETQITISHFEHSTLRNYFLGSPAGRRRPLDIDPFQQVPRDHQQCTYSRARYGENEP